MQFHPIQIRKVRKEEIQNNFVQCKEHMRDYFVSKLEEKRKKKLKMTLSACHNFIIVYTFKSVSVLIYCSIDENDRQQQKKTEKKICYFKNIIWHISNSNNNIRNKKLYRPGNSTPTNVTCYTQCSHKNFVCSLSIIQFFFSFSFTKC